MAAHEDLKRTHETKISSDKSFGLVFAAFFLLAALLPLVRHGSIRFWALGLSGLFGLVSFIRPSVLHPLNIVWARFGVLLNKVTNPIIMGILFYIVLTPTAFVMRLFGKDPLRLKHDETAKTYWITRVPPGPDPKSMSHQF